ncbi:formate-dependent nitrite reductase, membrane component [Desulfitobacterium dehalogenans ATCC 51507]|uniref:Formate-dependent nitrite reductase, membrane component n=1 Tax=Desulfitobacterium dehalogenans (strain ATCC 51507 / DSM 9161 / JW/IU-DC1) TaxID=756499 RepID=I4A4Q5_DESDJ|nr:NrfD/PsrC family molybdoenzyme membrane anchor subunit [Desulfitobacterium dehalogenans]AFL98939.1 formate-dependent nitrite reductase, membrane component [Desulfitobacterium dehalogenans ATCC 51507]
MDFSFVYEIQHHAAFGPLIVLYFFLAGLSAGLFLISALSTVFGWQPVKPLAKPAALMALAALVPGLLALVVDLGRPFRALYLFFNVNPTSIMSWGSFILLFYGIVCVPYIWFLWQGQEKRVKLFGKIGAVLAVCLGLYTGFLLAVVPGKPLWNSALLPVLFLVSGCVAALSLISLTKKVFTQEMVPGADYESALHTLKVWFVVLEVCLVFFHLLTVFFLGAQGELTVMNLLAGEKAFTFWGIQIAVGIVLPLILLSLKQSSATLGLVGVFSLAGVFALRYNFVFGGQELPTVGTQLYHQGGGMEWLSVIVLLALGVVLLFVLPYLSRRVFHSTSSKSISS